MSPVRLRSPAFGSRRPLLGGACDDPARRSPLCLATNGADASVVARPERNARLRLGVSLAPMQALISRFPALSAPVRIFPVRSGNRAARCIHAARRIVRPRTRCGVASISVDMRRYASMARRSATFSDVRPRTACRVEQNFARDHAARIIRLRRALQRARPVRGRFTARRAAVSLFDKENAGR